MRLRLSGSPIMTSSRMVFSQIKIERSIVLASLLLFCIYIYTYNINAPTPPQSQDHKVGTIPPAKQNHQSSPQNHTRVLVIARTKSEDVHWIERELGDVPDLETAIYTVDEPQPPYQVPKNKGHEVMAYLTYMIDNYDSLRDVTMFMHSHLITWHNNDLLDSNAAIMIKRLNSDRVIREGYMNMRCHWDPGCPDHLHPISGAGGNNNQQPEEVIFADSWLELFPNISVPVVLSQPCCGQFALSREKIRSMPKETYIYYRDWLIASKLPDRLSGRVWEYLWQVIFAEKHELCVDEHICYCDGYSVCFGGRKEYEHWYDLHKEKRRLEEDRNSMKQKQDQGQEEKLPVIETRLKELDREMEKLKQDALRNGLNPEFRARELRGIL